MSVRRITSCLLLTLCAVVAACAPVPPPAGPGTTLAPTTTAPTPTTAPPASGWEAEMLAAVNAQRAANGAPALVMCASLSRAAQAHSADQAATRTMSHTGSDGSTLRVRVERAGYLGWMGIAENVAMGYTSVSAVMAGWMGSSGHRANLLNANYQHVGFGLAYASNGAPYWTQNFGRSGSC